MNLLNFVKQLKITTRSVFNTMLKSQGKGADIEETNVIMFFVYLFIYLVVVVNFYGSCSINSCIQSGIFGPLEEVSYQLLRKISSNTEKALLLIMVIFADKLSKPGSTKIIIIICRIALQSTEK